MRAIAHRSTARRFIPSLPTLDPRRLAVRETNGSALFPFGHGGAVTYFYLGRAGVYHAVRQLARRPGTVLMPAYHHGVEIEAVERTGARIELYRIDAAMRVDVEDVERRLRRGRVAVLYVTHFAGFADPALAALTALAAEHGVPLFEDCAHALFSRDPTGRPLGSFGAAAVWCLYKVLPVPHGGVLRAPGLEPPCETMPPPLLSTLHHLAGLTLGHLERHGGSVGVKVRAALRATARASIDTVVTTIRTGTQHIARGDLELGASRLVSRLVAAFDGERVVTRRRRNFQRLASALAGRVDVLGAPLPDGCSPLFVPVRVRRKPELVVALRARGIDAIDFWNDAGRPSGHEDVTALRREVMELPCHQSLVDDDIDFVAAEVLEALPHA